MFMVIFHLLMLLIDKTPFAMTPFPTNCRFSEQIVTVYFQLEMLLTQAAQQDYRDAVFRHNLAEVETRNVEQLSLLQVLTRFVLDWQSSALLPTLWRTAHQTDNDICYQGY